MKKIGHHSETQAEIVTHLEKQGMTTFFAWLVCLEKDFLFVVFFNLFCRRCLGTAASEEEQKDDDVQQQLVFWQKVL